MLCYQFFLPPAESSATKSGVRCWGYSAFGQTGAGTTANIINATAVL